jgi:peptidoglycan/xylan/chitin deacetylase (PgdA/CDA1 family)
MRALKVAGFHAITLAQYVAYVHGFWRTLPPKPILLTFDDGRRDAFRVANNVLRNYGFHATMFTFAAWPTTNPGFSLSWPQLRAMQKSGVWTVQEHGGRGHEYLAFNATGAKGGIYAYRRYIPGQSGHAGYLEDFSAFERRVTSDIVWGSQQFQEQIPGYRPLAFAVPYANYGQEETNDRRIPEFTLPWLKGHFGVVFGGDYLAEGRGQPDEIHGRFSTLYSYRMTMGPKMSVGALYCRLNDWVRGTPMWMEYRCMRPPRGVNAIRGGVFTPAGRHAGILPP